MATMSFELYFFKTMCKRNVSAFFNNSLLIYILLSALINPFYCQDEEVVEQSVTESSVMIDVDVDSLTDAKCNNKIAGCCEELYIEIDDYLTKCFNLHQSKMPSTGEQNPNNLFKFFSCFVECKYKYKKYLGKGDSINMKMVKADAAKMYENRPKEKEYYVKMFETCRKDSTTMYNMIKNNPAGKALLKDNCKPYFLFVFICTAEYHKKYTCPYFRWEGARKTAAVTQCQQLKEKCYEIDGISL